jgi:hypothetical protein
VQRLGNSKHSNIVGPALLVGDPLRNVDYRAVTTVVTAAIFGDGFQGLGCCAPDIFRNLNVVAATQIVIGLAGTPPH